MLRTGEVTQLRMMASSIVIGGPSGAADLNAIRQVSRGQSAVSIDAATADRIKKESPSPKDFKQEDQSASASESGPANQTLEIAEARAGLLCRLISLVNGSTRLRLAVVQYLADLLNANVNLQLSSADTDSEPLRQIADAASGTGLASNDSRSSALTEVLQQQQITVPGLSQQERSVLESGQWVTLGVAAITVQNAQQLLLGATAVAALSAEALQIQVKFVRHCCCLAPSVHISCCSAAALRLYYPASRPLPCIGGSSSCLKGLRL